MIDNSGKIISVITINLNDQKGLQATVNSVRAQDSVFLEHIIIDGGSTDGSAEYIKQNTSCFSHWVSEPDKGVYDAQNKGLQKAKGEYVIFLNAGDTFYSNDVIASFISFANKKSHQIIYGNSNVITATGTSSTLTPPSKLNLDFWYRNTLNHQAVFFKRQVFQTYGQYDTLYKFCADMDVLLKVFKKEPDSFIHFSKIICNYQETGLSSKRENYNKIIEEKEAILSKQLTQEEYKSARSSYLRSQSFKTRWRIFLKNITGA